MRVKFPDPIYEEITVTPSVETQEILPSEGANAISKVTVNPVTSDIDENIKPENIVKGTTILGVEGTFEFITETLEVTPSMKVQTFTPNEGIDGFSTVTIEAITSAIDEDIKPENIKKDVEILGVTGTVIEVNNTTRDITENGVYTPEEPYTGFSEVTVDINTVNNTDIVIDKDGVYTPEEPYTGFGKVTVKIAPAVSELEISPKDTITVIEAKENEVGYSKVTIDLTWIEQALKELNAGDINTEEKPKLQNKTISTAGEFTCDAGYDGLGTVTVDLDWVDEAIEQARQETTIENLVNNSMESITIVASQLEAYAFYHKTNLKNIILENAETIKEFAFTDSGLTTLTINSMSVCHVENVANTFMNTPIAQGTGTIYVPTSLVEEYKKAEDWTTLSERIIAIT